MSALLTGKVQQMLACGQKLLKCTSPKHTVLNFFKYWHLKGEHLPTWESLSRIAQGDSDPGPYTGR